MWYLKAVFVIMLLKELWNYRKYIMILKNENYMNNLISNETILVVVWWWTVQALIIPGLEIKPDMLWFAQIEVTGEWNS